jgi:hypothetical protein
MATYGLRSRASGELATELVHEHRTSRTGTRPAQAAVLAVVSQTTEELSGGPYM